jgi:RNA polymerase sigma-70 factor, ECF subfamily
VALSRWHLQAGIAAEHAMAADYASTDWPRIVAYYETLLHIEPGAAPRLSHAIALAEAGDAHAACARIIALLPEVPAALKPHAHAALAHALTRLGEHDRARTAIDAAIGCARTDADRRLLERRRAALDQA